MKTMEVFIYAYKDGNKDEILVDITNCKDEADCRAAVDDMMENEAIYDSYEIAYMA